MRHLIAAVSWALASLLAAQGKQPRRPGVDTLVVYVFRHTDAESAANLRFFFDHGPMERDGAHYYVLIQESDRAEVSEVCLVGVLTPQTITKTPFEPLRVRAFRLCPSSTCSLRLGTCFCCDRSPAVRKVCAICPVLARAVDGHTVS